MISKPPINLLEKINQSGQNVEPNLQNSDKNPSETQFLPNATTTKPEVAAGKPVKSRLINLNWVNVFKNRPFAALTAYQNNYQTKPIPGNKSPFLYTSRQEQLDTIKLMFPKGPIDLGKKKCKFSPCLSEPS